MSDINDLKAGMRWARHQIGMNQNHWSRWIVIQISGKSPFLKAEKIFDPGSIYGLETFETFFLDVERWQFGPELNIPDENYTEVVEMKIDANKK